MNTLVAVGTGAAFLYSLVARPSLRASYSSRGLPADVYYEAVVLDHRLCARRQCTRGTRKGNTPSALRALAALQPANRTDVVRDGAERDLPIAEVVVVRQASGWRCHRR